MHFHLAKYAYYLQSSIQGHGVHSHFNDFEHSQWLPADIIQQLQWKKFKKILTHSYETVHYYNSLFKINNLHPTDICCNDDLKKIPILDKEEINKSLINLVSKQCSKRDLIPNSTGGSTGNNLHFYNDKRQSGLLTAMVFRNDNWADLHFGNRNVRLWGSSFDISIQSSLRNIIYNALSRTLFLSSYNLSDDNMLLYAKKIIDFQPKVIVGYPSTLTVFASFLKNKGVDNIHPTSIISSAEVLYDYQRKIIEDAFNCKVYNRYGSREFSALAQECNVHSGMHINSEHILMETLNEDGSSTEYDNEGELIITDLDNYAMPFIRYRIGDLGVLTEMSCTCGRGLPILTKITGRTFDVIICKNGKRLGGTFWTLLLRTAVRGIKQFQIIQESLEKITIRMVVNEHFERGNCETITSIIHSYCGSQMLVNYEILDNIPSTISGKFRFIVSKCKI